MFMEMRKLCAINGYRYNWNALLFLHSIYVISLLPHKPYTKCDDDKCARFNLPQLFQAIKSPKRLYAIPSM